VSRRRYRVDYLPLAERDIVDIVDYIARDRPQAARAFVDRLDRAVARLAVFPRSGKRPNDERLQRSGYRLLVVDGYLVFYVLVGTAVQIRRVIHGARRYEFLLRNE
jgi:plasmid stabilization system protein ParE